MTEIKLNKFSVQWNNNRFSENITSVTADQILYEAVIHSFIRASSHNQQQLLNTEAIDA